TGNVTGTPLQLPMEGFIYERNLTFRYDEALNRYYLSGWGDNNCTMDSFNGVSFRQPDYGKYNFFLSFNANDLDDWWYKQILTGDNDAIEITDITIDSNSDIYIVGKYFQSGSNPNPVTFGSHTFEDVTYGGHRPFVLKMNPQGVVQWSKIPDEQPAIIGGFFDISLNNNELAVALTGRRVVWGNYSIAYPRNIAVPYLLRLDKQTGEANCLYDIRSNGGVHLLTAVKADQGGNYVVGGAMRYSLFTDSPNGVAPLYNTSSSGVYTDFFMARLAATECGTAVSSTGDFELQQLRLYPNPTTGIVYIESESGVQHYEVYSVIGQRLMSGRGEVVNTEHLPSGTYIIKVKTSHGSISTHKIIRY